MESTNKIKRYQAGGFMVYQPLPIIPPSQPAVQAPASQESADVAEGGTLDKDLVKSLLGKGLTNDVMAFSKQIDDAYTQYSQMGEVERNTTYGRRLRSIMRGDLGQLNTLVRNKELFDAAIKNVETIGADSDIAVTKNGLIVKNLSNNQLAEVTHDEYLNLKGDNNFRLLTNAELVAEREYNPNLIGDTKTIEALRSAVSTNKVKEEVTKILTNLGSEKASTSGDRYFSYDGNPAVQNAAKQLIGMGTQGYYKISEMAESETNEHNLKLAAEAMWTNLSNNSKSLLKARAIEAGANASNLEQVAREMAISLLTPALSTSRKNTSEATFDGTMTKAAGGGGDTEAITDSINYVQALESGAGDPDPIEIDSGSGNALLLHGFTPGAFQVDNKPVGKTSMRDILPSIGGIIETRGASIGGNPIPYNKLDAIVYDGEAVHTVKAPVKIDPETRQTVPDFTLMENYNSAIQEIKRLGSRATRTAKEAVIRSYGFMPTIDSEGQVVPAVETAYFITFDGTVNNRVLQEAGDINQTFLRDVDKSEESRYDAIYQTGSITGDGKEIKGTDYDKWWRPNDKVYKGKVFIKLRDNGAIAARFAGGDALNTPKSANTPYALGSQVSTRQGIMNNKGSGTKYNFVE